MAVKSKAPQSGSRKAPAAPKNEDQDKQGTETQERDSPLLDLSDQAVKKLLKTAKARGYVTYDRAELGAALRGGVLRADRGHDGDAVRHGHQRRRDGGGRGGAGAVAADEPDEEEGRALTTQAVPATTSTRSEPTERTDDPVRMYLREMGSVELSVARGRDRHRQAHRGRPRGDDRRAVRKPADLPGHHHLARRAQRRQDSAPRHHRSGSHLRGPRGQDPAAGDPGRGAAAAASGRRRGAAARGRARRRGRLRERAVARRHGGRAEAEGAGDLRQHRRHLQEAAPPAGQEARAAGRGRAGLKAAAEGLREAARRDHRRR